MRPTLSIAIAAALVAAGLWAGAEAQGQKPGTPQPSAAAKIMFPPIPAPGYAAPRPADQVRAVYQFAAEHPEVMKFVPCYCGCEATGHPHNESCFVMSRDARGNVTQWDTHGYG